MESKEGELALPRANFPRVPHYCSGCPHNTSTKVPEGSRAQGGIGCHYMVTWMDRSTDTFTHMGGEGVTWAGQAAFTETPHVFQNLGDGTYFHSGSLAIRQSIAAGVNITYKILYNDAVAMTGGQPVDGTLTVPQIAQQMRAEGVQTIALVSDDIEKWTDPSIFPNGVTFHDRRELDAVQKTLREVKGTSVLIYDQTCATEKRRRRKRGKIVDPQKRVMVNSLVCEGCGDCGQKSFCVSRAAEGHRIRPQARDRPEQLQQGLQLRRRLLPQLRHRARRQAAQGQEGECRGQAGILPAPTVPQRPVAAMEHPDHRRRRHRRGHHRRAARHGRPPGRQGRERARPDRPGAEGRRGHHPHPHRQVAGRHPRRAHRRRRGRPGAGLRHGGGQRLLGAVEDPPERSTVVMNTYEAMPGTFTTRPDMQFPAADIVKAVSTALNGEAPLQIDATQIATALMGDAIAANLFMLGYAWQQGLVPISFEALMRAIELNGAAVEMNKTAFAWGRLAVVDLGAVIEAAGIVRNAPTAASAPRCRCRCWARPWERRRRVRADPVRADLRSEDELRHVPANAHGSDVAFLPLDDARLSRSLDEVIARRVAFLTEYQRRRATQSAIPISWRRCARWKRRRRRAAPTCPKRWPATSSS
jgi:indolepyruvate ferredoxin oxidoreductase